MLSPCGVLKEDFQDEGCVVCKSVRSVDTRDGYEPSHECYDNVPEFFKLWCTRIALSCVVGEAFFC